MKVTIFQYRLFHYRVRLFELMRERCQARGIELVLVHGQPYRDEIRKRDTGELSWATPVRNRYFPIEEKKDLCWQPMPRAARGSDLLVFMHENRLLANYWWMLRRALGFGPKVAFWGHGRDFQSRAPNGLRAKWKSLTLSWPDWWFAYTSLTETLLLDAGFDRERITVLDNAIDNQAFAADLAAVDDARLDALRAVFGLSEAHFVALYCGSLYQDKRLDVLFEACERVHRRHPAFRLLVAGDGALRGQVEAFCAARPWARALGVQYGVQKAALFRLARVSLCPGAIGLNILDAFVAGIPLMTRRDAKHGPEIAFLRHGENGLACKGETGDFADQLACLIEDREWLRRLGDGSRGSADHYSVDRMAERFVAGLTACLAASGARQGGRA
ncbi:glycosyltransferase family 4 protein [Paludibacterium purpuratum]|uniref:Glycosyltransferase involved in cell wall biosynthesis n=1 Tax=Paludibacterium purpuratum TaxID=1144873 RepID=A0A4R7B4B1_9NEIS|nr:glycosyltransferase family 4 protein [Paludibacterium purpuratum]TDR77814.1 glycosyltransferase involved in cell wall biosynthesis [Paludibacterium purpuratum]